MTDIGLTRSASFQIPFCGRMTCLIGYFKVALQVRRERQRLSTLDSRELADAGIARDAAIAESNRAFWDLPTGRRRTICRCRHSA